MNLSSPARSMPWSSGRVADTILREMEAHRKRLGAQLLELRKGKGWNQEDAAHEIGVGVKTWRLWERGKTMPYDSNIRRIAEVFEVDPDQLGQDKPSPLALGIFSQAPPFDEELSALVHGALEGELASILAGIKDQLAEQTEVLEEIKAEQAKLRSLIDGTDELRRLAREIVRGRPTAEPDPPQAPKRPATAKTTRAASQRKR